MNFQSIIFYFTYLKKSRAVYAALPAVTVHGNTEFTVNIKKSGRYRLTVPLL